MAGMAGQAGYLSQTAFAEKAGGTGQPDPTAFASNTLAASANSLNDLTVHPRVQRLAPLRGCP
jgi:hypothetical protein